MWRNSILPIACVLLFGCTSSVKKETKKKSGNSSASDISVIINVDNKKNEEFSAALADFYNERKLNASVDDADAKAFVIGDLSKDSNNVKLILRIYKGKEKNPCSNNIYEVAAKGDIGNGFNSLLNKLKANPRTPVCR